MARRFWPGGQRCRQVRSFQIARIRSASRSSASSPTRTTAWCVKSRLRFLRAAGAVAERPTACCTCASPEMRRPGSPSSGVRCSAVDAAVPITRAHTLIDQIERNVADERMSMAISVTLALVALLLATAGLYCDDGVSGRPADAGDWRAHGARCACIRRARDRPWARRHAGPRRRAVRSGTVGMGWPCSEEPALWHRCAGLCRALLPRRRFSLRRRSWRAGCRHGVRRAWIRLWRCAVSS